MSGDELVASCRLSGGDHGMDLLQWHVEGAEAADDLGGRDLVGCVAPVAGVGVDVGGFEQADAVVVAQRFDVQVGRAGEVPDGQR